MQNNHGITNWGAFPELMRDCLVCVCVCVCVRMRVRVQRRLEATLASCDLKAKGWFSLGIALRWCDSIRIHSKCVSSKS